MQVYQPALLYHLRQRLNSIYNDSVDHFTWKFRWDGLAPFALLDKLGRAIPTTVYDDGNFLQVDPRNLPNEMWTLIIKNIRLVDASTIPKATCSFYYFIHTTEYQTMSYEDVSNAITVFNTLVSQDGNDIDRSWNVVFDQAAPLYSNNHAMNGLRFDFTIDVPLWCCAN